MFMAYLRMDGSGNGLHCFNRRTWPHTRYKGIFRETLSIATAAILVKIMSIFLGDPPPRKIFFVFFSRPRRRSRFSPIDAQIFGATKS